MKTPLIEPLKANSMDLLLADSRPVVFQKGDIIIKAAAPYTDVIYLESGLVKVIQENSNGKTNIVKIINGGEFIGLSCLLCNYDNTYTCVALNTVTIRYITASPFMENVRQDMNLYEHIIRETLMGNQKDIKRLITINNKQLPGRVADVILYFYELNNKDKHFEFPLSREELAQFAGTTKESFIRTLTEFKNDRIIMLEGKEITINSLEIVQTLSRLG